MTEQTDDEEGYVTMTAAFTPIEAGQLSASLATVGGGVEVLKSILEDMIGFREAALSAGDILDDEQSQKARDTVDYLRVVQANILEFDSRMQHFWQHAEETIHDFYTEAAMDSDA